VRQPVEACHLAEHAQERRACELRRWANTVEKEVPRYSSPVASSATEKLMSLGFVTTSSSASKRTRPG